MAHVHTEIEFNLLLSGSTLYLFGGRLVRLHAGELAVFWAALPHQLVEVGPDTEVFWPTLPLSTFLGFAIPPLTKALLGGDWLQSASALAFDCERFNEWQADLERDDANIALLEMEARLRRLARDFTSLRDQNAVAGKINRPFATRAELGHIEAMAAFVSENYSQNIALPDIARAANLNVNYASTLFKREFGATLGDFLLRMRLAHAQRLLATSDKKIAEVAFLSGFGSSARFHAAFKEKTGDSPRAYRVATRQNMSGKQSGLP